MANSAFQPTVLTLPSTGGTGQGELNLITNPVAATDTTGWVGAGRGTSGGPLNPSVGTYFTVLNAASAESSTSGAYDVLTLPSGLQNRKLKVEFYYTSPAADTFKVSVYKGTTRVPLSTDSLGSTTLPQSTTGKFTAYFDTDNSGTWTLSITRTAGTGATALQFTQVVVGPGIQPQGAVVGEWQSYTPTIDGFGTVTSLEARYRRVGSSIEVVAKWTNGTPAASGARVYVPTGLTVAAGSQTQVVGRWFRDASTGSVRKSSPILQLNSAQQYVIFTSDDYTTASGPYTGLNGSALAVAGENLGVNFTVPIAEWSGSGTVTLAQNDVEYAACSSAWGVTDTTGANQVYGPAGVLGGTTTPATTNFAYLVKFNSPRQTGDQFTLEISTDRVVWTPLPSNWTNSGIFEGLRFDGTNYIGAGLDTRGGTGGIWVTFGKYISGTSTAWNGTWYWRVRKSSAGAAVGFGIVQPGVSSGLVSSLGLPGKTDGAAVTSGYVGEVVSSTGSGISVPTTGWTNIASITLSAGTWSIGTTTRAGGTVGATYLQAGVATASASSTGLVFGDTAGNVTVSSTADGSVSLPHIIKTISATTQYWLVAQSGGTTLSVGGRITAIRIA